MIDDVHPPPPYMYAVLSEIVQADLLYYRTSSEHSEQHLLQHAPLNMMQKKKIHFERTFIYKEGNFQNQYCYSFIEN